GRAGGGPAAGGLLPRAAGPARSGQGGRALSVVGGLPRPRRGGADRQGRGTHGGLCRPSTDGGGSAGDKALLPRKRGAGTRSGEEAARRGGGGGPVARSTPDRPRHRGAADRGGGALPLGRVLDDSPVQRQPARSGLVRKGAALRLSGQTRAASRARYTSAHSLCVEWGACRSRTNIESSTSAAASPAKSATSGRC